MCTEGSEQRADTDSGSAEVVDLIDLQAGINLAASGQNLINLIGGNGVDPQLKSRRAKKRLTSPLFLGYYAHILSPGGWINLKTDSKHLFGYTNEVVRRYGLPCEVSNADIYGTGYADEVLSVKTAYEKRFLEMGLPITYTRFSLAGRHKFPWFDWEEDEKAEKDNEEARLG